MSILVPLLVAILGGLIYLLSSKAQFQELGRIMFAAGLLVTLLLVGPESLSVLRQ